MKQEVRSSERLGPDPIPLASEAQASSKGRTGTPREPSLQRACFGGRPRGWVTSAGMMEVSACRSEVMVVLIEGCWRR